MHIFHFAGVNLEKSREWRWPWRHWTLHLCVRCALGFKHKLTACTGRHRTRARPCSCVRCGLTSASASDWEHRTLRERPMVLVRWSCAFDNLSAHGSGEYRTRPVLTWPRLVVCRWPLEMDAWDWDHGHVLCFKHRTQVLSVRWLLLERSGGLMFCLVKEPTTLFVWGAYKYVLAGLGITLLAFLTTRHPCEPKQTPPTHLLHRLIIFVKLRVIPSVFA